MPTHFILRFTLLMLGLTLMAFGVALSIRSLLGTSPISSIPYVYSYFIPLSVGVLTIIMHIFFILMQMLLLGKKFQWIQWLQLPIGVVFGMGIDAMLWLTQDMQITSYIGQIVCCLFSCLVTALGVCLQIKANLVFLAGEGLYQAISQRFKLDFASCKVYGDVALVIIASISSLFMLHNIVGIREGTVITALFVGVLVKKMLPYFQFLHFPAQVKASY